MPTVDRVAFTLFGLDVYWYGVIMGLAIIAAVVLCMVREQRLGLKRDTTIDLSLWIVPFALIGARLYFVAFSWADYAANPLLIFDVRSGGMAIYGGIIAGLIVGLVFSRVRKQSFGALADLVAPGLALGQAIGRVANFINQEAYGYAVTDPALQFFPIGVFIEADGQWHLATFFYESVWCLLLCAGLLIAERRHLFKKKGDTFVWYAMLYALERSVVEGLRTDSLMLGPLRVSQWLSIAAFVACAAYLLLRPKANASEKIQTKD